MNETIIETRDEIKERPKIYLKSMTFNDGTQVTLNKSSIVIFTGANNCGKSQALKDIEIILSSSSHETPVVISNLDSVFLGQIDEVDFLSENFNKRPDGKYELLKSGYPFGLKQLHDSWNYHKLIIGLHGLFVKRLSTEERLTTSNALARQNLNDNLAIYRMSGNEKLAQEISDLFFQAFGEDLVVNRNDFYTIPLHVGHAPDKSKYTIKQQDEYYSLVEKLPTLQSQGDGMRSYASILLDTFTSVHTITMIDEPEAFLHPPQARMLGRMLAKNNPEDRQLFLATHSEDFLQGIIDADNSNVTVIRIDRNSDINKMSILRNTEIEKLWKNPLLRYSNILSSLFHEKVIVCESDYDCLFYQAMMNSIFSSREEYASDVLFIHVGGKTRVKEVVSALKAVNVPVVAVCDFDLINTSHIFKPLSEAFGIDWETELKENMKIIYDTMNGKSDNGNDPWKQIKKIGKTGLTGDAPAAYERVEKTCRSYGLFIVPVGEMECFDKTVNKEKKEWVYYVLENYDLGGEPRLEQAREFVRDIIEFKI